MHFTKRQAQLKVSAACKGEEKRGLRHILSGNAGLVSQSSSQHERLQIHTYTFTLMIVKHQDITVHMPLCPQGQGPPKTKYCST